MEALTARVRVVEERVQTLKGIVEGHEPWSHRTRLHKLESESQAARLASEALVAYRSERDRFGVRLREWGSFALAATAILVSLFR